MKYYNNKLMMLVCATAFSVTACSSSNSFSDPVDFDTPSEAPIRYRHKEQPKLSLPQPMESIHWHRVR